VDISILSTRVHREAEKRGLVLRFLKPPDYEVLQVCERASDGVLDGIGHVTGTGGGPPHVAYAMNRRTRNNDEIALGLMTWEAGVLAILAAYDREQC
jgi:hypothetical protein